MHRAEKEVVKLQEQAEERLRALQKDVAEEEENFQVWFGRGYIAQATPLVSKMNIMRKMKCHLAC